MKTERVDNAISNRTRDRSSKETQRVKPYDQSRLSIWIYDTPQIEYSDEIHTNYSNKYVDGWPFNGILSLNEMCPVQARCEIWAEKATIRF